jgi:hypothetical protein
LTGENGSGHGDFFYRKKKLMYVFHTHQSNTKVAPRRTAVIPARFRKSGPDEDELQVDKKGFRYLRLER